VTTEEKLWINAAERRFSAVDRALFQPQASELRRSARSCRAVGVVAHHL